MSALKASLFAVGATVEGIGILCIAWPDLIPGARRFSNWSRSRWQRIKYQVRTLLGHPPQGRVYSGTLGPSGIGFGAGPLYGDYWVGVASDAPLEEKVEYLLRRDDETRTALSELKRSVRDLGQRIGDFEEHLQGRLDNLRAEMQQHVAETVEAIRVEYRPLRIAGAFLLAIGLGMVTTANFVS